MSRIAIQNKIIETLNDISGVEHVFTYEPEFSTPEDFIAGGTLADESAISLWIVRRTRTQVSNSNNKSYLSPCVMELVHSFQIRMFWAYLNDAGVVEDQMQTVIDATLLAFAPLRSMDNTAFDTPEPLTLTSISGGNLQSINGFWADFTISLLELDEIGAPL